MATTSSTSRAGELRQATTGRSIDEFDFGHDLIDYLKEYAREKPEVAALWCLGIGFILGWKLKPW
jgi:hypothetical protein